jgi:stalled ribosome alternative rescue factor ArfA
MVTPERRKLLRQQAEAIFKARKGKGKNNSKAKKYAPAYFSGGNK